MHSSKGMELEFLYLTQIVRSEFTSKQPEIGETGTDSRGKVDFISFLLEI